MLTALRISVIDENVAKTQGLDSLEPLLIIQVLGGKKPVIYFRRTSALDVYVVSNQHHPHCDQEFKLKLTSVANRKLQAKLHAQVSKHK